ncbi:RNA polymerase subunit sigma [Veronia nyctiphanis]|uniref:RNA polymerase sigma factor n=1 Tax=Veronia nyctiphanis TaxID=1278244 RepID=A0A4V1LSU8_9GAMM|nr:sigma-70 family RNA polymerase sigma factor [Veronia nyctiphanis]RXJ72948.1 RNA polymerase subunit sigma [Veronia nyctiphanis]
MALNFFKKSRNKKAEDQVSIAMNKEKRYEALVRVWHKDLFRYAYWLTKDRDVAEDLVQETCLRAWRSMDSLLDDKAAKSWLITILRRENARRFERKQLELVDIDDHQIETPTPSGETNIENRWLHKQIMRLAPEYREPLVLQVMAGFSGEEIASILDLNKNTVMTRLFRARSQLKEFMEHQESSTGGQISGRT